jgi:trans-aconitate 2-methyltransferase
MTWSPGQYLAFEDERTRPARDLVGAIRLGDARHVLDLGCGPGNSTEVLAARFPGAEVAGLDSSPDMIAAARARLPRLRFEVASVEAWTGGAPDLATPEVILANAVFQWIPGHDRLLPAVAARLAPAGAALALQMPDNLNEPSHILMREVAAEGPWASTLSEAAAARAVLPDAAWYYALLRPLFSRVDIWRTTYHHPLAGAAALVEWVKGTGLRPFLEPLSSADRAAYLETYQARIAEAYPALPDGTVLLPFPRLFIVGER